MTAARAPEFTAAALDNIEETGADWQADLTRMRDGTLSEAGLLAFCLEGAEDDREPGWIDYVHALAAFGAWLDRTSVRASELAAGDVILQNGVAVNLTRVTRDAGPFISLEWEGGEATVEPADEMAVPPRALV